MRQWTEGNVLPRGSIVQRVVKEAMSTARGRSVGKDHVCLSPMNTKGVVHNPLADFNADLTALCVICGGQVEDEQCFLYARERAGLDEREEESMGAGKRSAGAVFGMQ